MFALQKKGKFEFTCLSKTEDDLDRAIIRAFGRWQGMQSLGSNKTIADFMADKIKVAITISEI
jgi:hypothetical protein